MKNKALFIQMRFMGNIYGKRGVFMQMKGLRVMIMGITIALLAATAVYAGTWQTDSSGWLYQNDDGSYVRNQWVQDRGKWYYFNSKGYMLSSTTTPDGYQVDSDGVLIDSNAKTSSAGQTIGKITLVPESCRIEDYTYSTSYDKKLVMSYKITNASDTAYGYAYVGWKAELPDGIWLKNWADLQDMKLKQIPPKTSKTVDVSFLVPKETPVSEITASYSFMNYDQLFWKDFNALNEGTLPQKEYAKKYCDKELMTFTIPINKDSLD